MCTASAPGSKSSTPVTVPPAAAGSHTATATALVIVEEQRGQGGTCAQSIATGPSCGGVHREPRRRRRSTSWRMALVLRVLIADLPSTDELSQLSGPSAVTSKPTAPEGERREQRAAKVTPVRSGLPSATTSPPILDEVFLALTGRIAQPDPAEVREGDSMIAIAVPETAEAQGSDAFRKTLTLTIAHRNLLDIRSDAEQLTGMTVQALMFLVLFVYVFGGAIAGPTPSSGWRLAARSRSPLKALL